MNDLGGGNISLNLNDPTTHSSDTGVSIQKLQELNSEGAWQALKTLKHGLQRQYDRTSHKYVCTRLNWEQTNKKGVQVPSCTVLLCRRINTVLLCRITCSSWCHNPKNHEDSDQLLHRYSALLVSCVYRLYIFI